MLAVCGSEKAKRLWMHLSPPFVSQEDSRVSIVYIKKTEKRLFTLPSRHPERRVWFISGVKKTEEEEGGEKNERETEP